MNAQTHDAYLAIIDDAEARLAVAEGTRVLAVGLAEIAEARIAALEAAARAIVVDCRVPRGDYLGDLCRWCENTLDRDGHRPGCPVGILAALLEDA